MTIRRGALDKETFVGRLGSDNGMITRINRGSTVQGTELFDASSGTINVAGSASSPNTNTWVHTPVHSPNIAIVDIVWMANLLNGGNIDITLVQYGGFTMTRLGLDLVGPYNVSKYGLINPPAGAQNVDITWQNDDGASQSGGMATSTTLYSTSGGSATFGSYDSSSDATSPITNDVTGLSINNVMAHGYIVYDASSAAVTVTINGTNETQRSGFTTFFQAGEYLRVQLGTSTQDSAVGTVTASATLSANRSSLIQSVEVRAL